MALAFANIGTRTLGSGASSYALTLTRALAAGELGLCMVVNTKSASPDLPTLSGGGVTWVQVATVTPFSNTRMTLFRAQGTAPSGVTLTADFAGLSQTGILMICDAVTGARPDTANNGAGCIVQTVTGTNATASVDYSVTGAALANPTNAQWTAHVLGSQVTISALDGGTILATVGKGSPATGSGTNYEIGDNHSRVTMTSANIQGILLEIAQQAALVLGGTITPTGTLSKKMFDIYAGTITPIGTLARLGLRFRSFGGTITPVGSLSAGRLLTKALAGTITPVGTLTRAKFNTFYAALSGTITPVGTLTVRFLGLHYITLTGMITPVGTLVSKVRHFLLSKSTEESATLTPSTQTAATLTPTSGEAAILTPTDDIEG